MVYYQRTFVCERCHAREYPYEGPCFAAFLLHVIVLAGAVSGFFGFCIGVSWGESNYKRSLISARNSMWREAVEAGHAIEVEGTNGTGYAWRDK